MPPIIKQNRKIFTGGGGDTTAIDNRVTVLENNEKRVTYFYPIPSGTSGTVSLPTGATIQLDELYEAEDAYLTTIVNTRPGHDSPETAGGVIVDVSSFDALGNYTLDGTPSAYPVALIYQFLISELDYSTLDKTYEIDVEEMFISEPMSNIFIGTGGGRTSTTALTYDITNSVFKTGSQASLGTTYKAQFNVGGTNPIAMGLVSTFNTVWLNQGTPSSSNYSFLASTLALQINATSNITFYLNNTIRAEFSTRFTFLPPASVTGANSVFLFRTPLDTGQTASTEQIGFEFDMATNTVQHSTGALATSRDFLIKARTHRFVGASTLTDAATFAISGPPIAGTNATITNTYALWVQTGNVNLGESVNVKTGTTTGSKIGNTTNDKIGFWNTTPIIQPTTGVAAATFVTNTSLIADDTATFDGYTIGQVVKALRNTGLLA
jgi:hypothetical protein